MAIVQGCTKKKYHNCHSTSRGQTLQKTGNASESVDTTRGPGTRTARTRPLSDSPPFHKDTTAAPLVSFANYHPPFVRVRNTVTSSSSPPPPPTSLL
eukprot:1659006-Rhodomonas_salina.3